MNKKAGYGTIGTIVIIVLGLIVLALIIGGPIKTAYEFAKEKLFGEQGLFSIVKPSKEEEFIPFVPVERRIHLPPEKNAALGTLIEKSIECMKMYDITGRPVNCFEFKIDPAKFFVVITKDDFENTLKSSPEAFSAELIVLNRPILPTPAQTVVSSPFYAYKYYFEWNIGSSEFIDIGTGTFYMCVKQNPYDFYIPYVYITRNVKEDCPVLF